MSNVREPLIETSRRRSFSQRCFRAGAPKRRLHVGICVTLACFLLGAVLWGTLMLGGGQQDRQPDKRPPWYSFHSASQHGGGPDPDSDATPSHCSVTQMNLASRIHLDPVTAAARRRLLKVLCLQVPVSTTWQVYKDFLSSLPQLQPAPPPAVMSTVSGPTAEHYREVWGFLASIYSNITGSKHLLSCKHTVNRIEHFDPKDVSVPKYLIAANFHNSETTLPNLIHQVMQLILYLPPGHALISIYESGSKDGTKYWLQLLRMLLMPLDVPYSIVSDGKLRRQPGQERIDFLARVRNAALEPLLYPNSPLLEQQEEGFAARAAQFNPDFVIFINDIFFCYPDVVRLLQYQGDVTCGMDFWMAPPNKGGSSSTSKKSGGNTKPASHTMSGGGMLVLQAGSATGSKRRDVTIEKLEAMTRAALKKAGLGLDPSPEERQQATKGPATAASSATSAADMEVGKELQQQQLQSQQAQENPLLSVIRAGDAIMAKAKARAEGSIAEALMAEQMEQLQPGSSSGAGSSSGGSTAELGDDEEEGEEAVSMASAQRRGLRAVAAADDADEDAEEMVGSGRSVQVPSSSSIQRRFSFEPTHTRSLLHEKLDHNWGDQTKLLFYDKWVARDVSGDKIKNNYPYSYYKPTADRIRNGLPLPAYCCWNGVVVLKYAPFKQGVRFRSHMEDECSASECSLMCDDFHRLGYSNVIMDPNVRVAYTWAQLPYVYSKQVERVEVKAWPEVKNEAQKVMRESATTKRHFDQVLCCDLKPGRDGINFKKDCRKDDVLKVNYTSLYFSVSQTGMAWNNVTFTTSTPAGATEYRRTRATARSARAARARTRAHQL